MKCRTANISAIVIALMLFLAPGNGALALPLTETIYMIPEYSVEIFFRDEIFQTDRYARKDSAGLGFGVTDDFSLWMSIEYLSQGPFKVKRSEIGDLFFKGKFFIGDYAGNDVHLGFLMELRFPLGKDAYGSTYWRNLALGRYELTLGPFARFDVVDILFLHLNLFYTFREGRAEDFFGGFYFDITERDTWKKVFGLNPREEDTFLSVNRLKNDYITASLALNTGLLYPVVPYIELHGAVRVSRSHIDTGSVPIEAAKYNSFLLSGGVRYFFREALYLGVYTVQNPLRRSQNEFIQSIYGLELSLQL
ncbi:MAG: hypothetical protein JW838_04220 [Spirochaetes bacterium]|nr:hypothetical protein [Spirochaetota bacterium]